MKRLISLAALLLVAAVDTPSARAAKDSLAALSTQPSMNVFRRFSVDAAKMTGFYGDVLGLKALPALRMPGGGSMILFQIGTGQVKLQATPAASDTRRARCVTSADFACSRSSSPTSRR